MTARIRPLTPSELGVDQQTLYAAITEGPRAQGPQHFPLTAADGSLRGPFGVFLLSPAVGGALQELGSTLRYQTQLTDRCRELAILLVAAHHDSAFERESHEAIAIARGFGTSDLAGIRVQNLSGLAGIEATVGRAVLALLQGDLDDREWVEASTELGAATVFELTTLVGYYSTLALQLRVFRVES